MNGVMPLRNQSGFTFIEIMIAFALFAFLIIVITSMMFYGGKQQNLIQRRGELFQFQQQLMLDLRAKPLPSP